MKKFKPEAYIFNAPQTPNDVEVKEILDRYRLLMGMTWYDFILVGSSLIMRTDNPEIADFVLSHVKSRPKPGRPKGKSVRMQLNRMGVRHQDIQSDYK